MTAVKICGLRTAAHALAAADAGADMLGLIFAPSRRQVTVEQAAAIAAALKTRGGARPLLVGVFVNEATERAIEIAERCALDVIQLSGDEGTDEIARFGPRRLLKALRLSGAPVEQGWLASDPAIGLLVDAHVPGSYGGAGVVADWERAAHLAAQRPIVLAGGLSPANVADAIRHVRPWGVDVSSGVETDGVKDDAKIRAFIAAARAADEQATREESS